MEKLTSFFNYKEWFKICSKVKRVILKNIRPDTIFFIKVSEFSLLIHHLALDDPLGGIRQSVKCTHLPDNFTTPLQDQRVPPHTDDGVRCRVVPSLMASPCDRLVTGDPLPTGCRPTDPSEAGRPRRQCHHSAGFRAIRPLWCGGEGEWDGQ